MPVRTLSGNCSTAAGRQTGRMMKIVTTVIGRNVLCESTLGGYTEVSTQNESGDCVISLWTYASLSVIILVCVYVHNEGI